MAEQRPEDRPNGSKRRAFTPPRAASQPHAARPAAAHSSTAPAPGLRRLPARIPIPRSQQWMFWSMLLLVIAMAVYLIRLRERASDRFALAAQPLPLTSADTHEQPLRLYLANDLNGSLVEKPLRFPLPSDPNARARVVLAKLLDEYADPGSTHPLHSAATVADPGSAGIEEVYLLPIPGLPASRGQLAVVDLTTAFVHNHPSGIEPETLTLLSMIATLKANLPGVTQVRFLVDGQPQATLAGHADLTHAYLAAATQMNLDADQDAARASHDRREP